MLLPSSSKSKHAETWSPKNARGQLDGYTGEEEMTPFSYFFLTLPAA
jgi:hypothetical protein